MTTSPARPPSESTTDSQREPPPQLPRRGWTAEDEGPDPFGQTGVRQYIGKSLMWLGLVGALLTAAVWYRSTFYYDIAEWRSKDQALRLRSSYSRLTMDFAFFPNQNSSGGWMYRGGYIRRVQDGWPDSVWKIIGIEINPQPLEGGAASGFWLRMKWRFLLMCMLGVPIVRWMVILIRHRREAYE